MEESYGDIRVRLMRNLSALRDQRGLSLSDMGKILDLTKAAVYKMEHGKSEISLRHLCTLSQHFDIPLYNLLFRELSGESS